MGFHSNYNVEKSLCANALRFVQAIDAVKHFNKIIMEKEKSNTDFLMELKQATEVEARQISDAQTEKKIKQKLLINRIRKNLFGG